MLSKNSIFPHGMEKDDLWLLKKAIKMIKEEMEQDVLSSNFDCSSWQEARTARVKAEQDDEDRDPRSTAVSPSTSTRRRKKSLTL